ncbi:MAG: FeoC-like transcriptional regulator [Chloroflexaceae bacterium]
MLQQVLQALETTSGPLSLDELSRRLEIERSALEGMIAFWVRKGRLQASAGRACGHGCGHCGLRAEGCVFSAGGPQTIALTEPARR